MTSLGMGIGIGYMIFVVLGLIITAVVLYSTKRGRRDKGEGVDIGKAERAEPWWALFIVVLLGILLALTIWRAPWFQDNGPGQRVQVTGIQFGWAVQPTSVKVNEPVQFNVTSMDVNHAMGLFDPEGRLIMNVQAVPNYTTTRTHTFTEPGTYIIRCFEFCGYQHHKMIYPAFKVTA